MPLCYGGGIRDSEQAARIVGLGVEKVALSSAVVSNPELVVSIADAVGRQSVVAVLDVARNQSGGYSVFVSNGRLDAGQDPFQLAGRLETHGIGEIVINSIDNDGVMGGYDLDLLRRMREVVSVPMTVLGGAGSHGDLAGLMAEYGVIGAAAGSLFVFRGKYRAVLINYPTEDEKQVILRHQKSERTE
jgi:cyclase